MLQEVNTAYDNVKEVDCLDVSKEGTDAWEAASKRLFRFKFHYIIFRNISLLLVYVGLPCK